MQRIEEGTDETIQAVRNTLPEPYNCKNEIMYGIIPNNLVSGQIDLPDLRPVAITLRTYTFHRIMAVTSGAAFYAWLCKEDGKIYF